MQRRAVRVAHEAARRLEDHRQQDLRDGLAAIDAELDVPRSFPDEVLAEAEAAARSPSLPDLDRTDLPLLTIDPEGSRDLDQALHIDRAGGGTGGSAGSGGYRVSYAIADVAAFVAPGGAVDAEAHRRGETLYGVGDKVPLHPPVLSEQACSLLPDGPRPAVLWTIDLDSDGERTGVRVERALVRSRAQLTYAEAQRDLDAGRADPVLVLLREVGGLRLERERARGGVSLPLPDQEVDCVDGRVQLSFRQPLPVEAWNAQISLLTGISAAALMTEGRIGVLRTVPPPDPRDVDRLRRVAAALHVAWPEQTTYPEFVRGLDAGRAAEAAVLTASTSLLRGSAYAWFDGEVPEQPLHSALASTYSHVTAPLRRLVDRYTGEVCLALGAGRPVPEWTRSALPGLPETMAATGRRANQYDRALLDLVEAVLLRDRVGELFGAAVVDVDKDGNRGHVMVREPAVEAEVTATEPPLPLGEEVTVRLEEADPAGRRVRFSLAGSATRGGPVAASSPPGKSQP